MIRRAFMPPVVARRSAFGSADMTRRARRLDLKPLVEIILPQISYWISGGCEATLAGTATGSERNTGFQNPALQPAIAQ